MNHPDPTPRRRFTDEEIKDIIESNSMEEALEIFCGELKIEIQKKYPGDHMNWYTAKKLRAMLEQAGFENIWESRYGQSKFSPMRNTDLFDATRPEESLYMECQKN